MLFRTVSDVLCSIIKDSLRIHKPGCGFSKTCIVEGELVVYSDFVRHSPCQAVTYLLTYDRQTRSFLSTRSGIMLHVEAAS